MTIDSFFSKDSPLKHSFNNFTPRPQQLIMARGIAYCLQHSKHYIAEAPPGVGKSLAYLTPVILWAVKNNKKAIVSTCTKVLQRQLFEKDLPALNNVIGGFKYALCIGGENYLCPKRLSHAETIGIFDKTEDSTIIVKLAEWYKSSEDGTASDLKFPVLRRLWKKVCRDADFCNTSCDYSDDCRYMDAVDAQEEADILVTNHHIAFNNIKAQYKLLPPVGTVVFDESHEIEDVATAAFSIEVVSTKIQGILSLLQHQIHRGADIKNQSAISSAISGISQEIKRVYGCLGDGTGILDDRDMPISLLSDHISILAELLAKSGSDILAVCSSKLKAIAVDMITLEQHQAGGGSSTEFVYWKVANRDGWKITATPISVAPILRGRLFNKIPSVHLVSATMSVNGSFSFFKSTVGINKDCAESILSTPFDYQRQMTVYIPPMPAPNTPAYAGALQREVGKLLTKFHGHTLILFTSYKLMVETYDLMEKQLPNLCFFKQGSMSNNKLIDEFKKTPHSVLMGLNTFWQGVDIPGDALKCVIITKLPFARPDSPIALARQRSLERRGLNPFVVYQVPKSILLFKQGVGRLIRTVTDTGVVAILDSRVSSTSYGKRFLAALPDCKITEDLREIA